MLANGLLIANNEGGQRNSCVLGRSELLAGYCLIDQFSWRGLASDSPSKNGLVSRQKTIQSVGSIGAFSKRFRLEPSIQVTFKFTFFEH